MSGWGWKAFIGLGAKAENIPLILNFLAYSREDYLRKPDENKQVSSKYEEEKMQ